MVTDPAPGPAPGPVPAIPRRRGNPPATTQTNPHMQLDQQPDTDQPRTLLELALADLPEVTWRESQISVPGARALTLSRDRAGGPADAFMVATEFAHLHPAPDHSLHLMLPLDVARAAIDAGWAEQHPVAKRGLIPAGAVMVYAPRDAAEVEIVAELVRISHDYARGA